MRENKVKHYIIATIVLIYLFLPLIATFFFSIATKWQASTLPEGITFEWYAKLFADEKFLMALGRSFIICTISVIASLIIMIPTVFIVFIYFKKAEKLLSAICMIPFAIPGVVYAVGLIKLYSSGPINISGTIWILLAAFFVIILPYVYQGIKNSLRAIDGEKLMEAAQMLNASMPQAFIHVILPNITKGIFTACLLAFSILFGEFVLTNLLVGGEFETVQIYLFSMQTQSGHISSAVVIIYFLSILLISFLASKINDLKTNHR